MNILYRDIKQLKINVTDLKEKIIFFQEHIFDNIYYVDMNSFYLDYTNMSIVINEAKVDNSLYLYDTVTLDEVKSKFKNCPGVFRIPVLSQDGRLLGEYYDSASFGKSLYKRIEDRCCELLEIDYFQSLFNKWELSNDSYCIDTEICDQYRKYLNCEKKKISISNILIPSIINDVIPFLIEKGVCFFVANGIKKSDLKNITDSEKHYLRKSLEEAINDDEHVSRICGEDIESKKYLLMHKNDINRISKIVFNGICNKLMDIEEPFFNVINGKRITVGNNIAEEGQNIHIFGPCIVQGICVCDSKTIPSILQKIINYNHFKNIHVHNHGLSYGKDLLNDLLGMMSTRLSKGDVVVWMSGFSSAEKELFKKMNLPFIDCVECVRSFHDWFYNIPFHCNSFANEIFANKIFNTIRCNLISTSNCDKNKFSVIKSKNIDLSYNPEALLESSELKSYVNQLNKYRDFSKGKAKIGSIVMHANPCTLGHIFLINKALENVEFLYIFLIQYSYNNNFDYIDREWMLKENFIYNDRVCIIPSGEILASPLSFPEYFSRTNNNNINPILDNKIFTYYIAPTLGIKYRFFGSEPNDVVTNTFLHECQKELPSQGIEVIVIQRKEIDGIPISAKNVRHLWKSRNYKEIIKFIPYSSYIRLLELNNDKTEYNIKLYIK